MVVKGGDGPLTLSRARFLHAPDRESSSLVRRSHNFPTSFEFECFPSSAEWRVHSSNHMRQEKLPRRSQNV